MKDGALQDSGPAAAAPAPAPAAPVVSILVISYNTRELTLACLRSVAAETTLPHEVIVVDNASADGSAAAIAAEFPDVLLIEPGGNLGFARGNNLAARHARGEYLLLLNSDTVVLDGAIDKLVAFAREKPEARIWGGRTLFPDGTLNPSSCWRLPSLWSIFCRAAGLNAVFPNSPLFHSEAYAGWKRDSVRAVGMVVGCFLMTTRAFWEALGGFDETLFMYGDDTDLSFRARALGAEPHVTPAATIVHHGGASDRVRADKMVKLLSAKVTVTKRHFRGWRRGPALVLLRLWPFTRLLATRALAGLTGRPRLREAAAVWGEIWARRAAWRDGYPDPPAKGAADAAPSPSPAPETLPGAAPRQLYIAWIAFQRRPESMRPYVGYRLLHLPPPSERRLLKPAGYLLQAWRTVRAVAAESPEVVWLQLPPTPLLHVVFLWRLVSRGRFKIVADCHNGTFQTAWARVPLLVTLLNRCDGAMAHNAEVAALARRMGVSDRVLSVVETRPAQIAEAEGEAAAAPAARPVVLVPSSFGYDEPVEALLAAARALPEADFLVTGRRRKAEARGYVRAAPANLRFTDYLTAEEYTRLLRRADVVLGLTTVEGVQLSVANEAVGAGRALVLSDTAILRELFGAAALLARNEPAALAAALSRALAERPALEARSRALAAARETRWRGQIDPLLARLAS